MKLQGGFRYAWVTAAMDEETTIQAAILGTSLAQVITLADTVVLIPGDLGVKHRQLLAQCFNSVVQIDLNENCLSPNLLSIDLLKIWAFNMEMYTKIAIVSQKSKILQNCDELFDLEKEYYMTDAYEPQYFPSLLVIKPNSEVYNKILNITNKQHFSWSHLFTDSCEVFGKETLFKLDRIYSVDLNYTKLRELQTVKIIQSSKLTVGEDTGIQKITKLWDSCQSDINIMLHGNSHEHSILRLYDGTFNRRNYYYKDSIAIVGYSCRFPEANNIDEFWELLMKGGDGIRSTPAERFELFHLDEKKYVEFKGGFLKCPIDEFDAKFFEISPREAELIDPQQRLLMEVAWEALENAAINPHSLKGSNTGVFTGVWKMEYERLVKENTPTKAFHNIILGNSFAATSARISNFLGLNGPNIATESGCSSSMVALHLACESLKRKETDLGLVMGANIIEILEEGVPILAKDGHCKTFDEKADGFGRAEGIAVIVLKRLTDAVKSGDRVMGIIRGSGISNEGTSSSFGTPSKMCQEIAVRGALKNSGVRPEEVDFVEAHGTGTPVGDPIEFAALSACYASKREKPLVIGSVKTNIGHTESVAGLASIIKIILSLKNEIIPSHRNLDTLNSDIDLETIPAIIPIDQQPWKSNKERVRIAGVSSFGISGTNVHVLLEEPPNDNKYGSVVINSKEEENTYTILNLSAKTETAFYELVHCYYEFLMNNPQVDINDLCFTANNGRAHFNYRASFIEKDISKLTEAFKTKTFACPVPKETMKIAFLFTGQGPQYLGMAHGLYKSNCIFRSYFNKCANIIKTETGIIIQDVLWGDKNGSLLQKCAPCQLSIFCVQYAILKLLFSLGVKPDFVLGHSIGAFAAAVASGILDLEDALILLTKSSQLISDLPPGGMMVIHSSKEKASELISEFSKNNRNEWLDIAGFNCPEEIVVAGRMESLKKCQKICTANKIRCKILAAPHAFHSQDIEGILSKFNYVTSKIKYKTQSCQYVSGTTGSLLTADEMKDGKYWLKHARDPVNFQNGMQTLAENGCNTFIEIGPWSTLLALGVKNAVVENSLWLPTLQQNKDDWEVLLESLKSLYLNGANINWFSIFPPDNRKKLELPTYPFQRQKYWINIPEKHEINIIHPLLGKKVSLVNKSETVYTNNLNLKEFEYLKDHQVANLVIMPCAGFLEIILAVGNDLLQIGNNSKEIQVKDFILEYAFSFEEGKQYEMQVVATPLEGQNDLLVVGVHIFNKLHGWKRHASATVTLLEDKDIKLKFLCENVESLKKRLQDTNSSDVFYTEVQKKGFVFGEAFRSIESIWLLENEAFAVIPIKLSNWNLEEYIYHPIVLDSMLQSIALITMEMKDQQLWLPVGMENCYAFSGILSDVVYAYANWDAESKSGTVSLYDQDFNLLSSMVGVHFVATTIGSFQNTIAGQRKSMPDLYEEIWSPRLGPLQSRIDMKSIKDFADIIPSVEISMEKALESYDPSVQNLLDHYIHLRLIEMFNENGIFLTLGETYCTSTIMVDNLVSINHLKFFDRIIEMFIEDGNIVQNDSGDWKVVKAFPSRNEIQLELKKLHNAIKMVLPVDLELLDKCMDNVWNVVTGKVDAITALFGRNDINILDLYTKGLNISLANIRMAKFLCLILSDFKSSKGKPIIRIIEIGGGSAATSMVILKAFKENGISYQYTFTDVSAQFFENAKKELSSFEMVEYKILDIEKDPSTQGFCPHHYDIVVASNVIHAAENLRVAAANVRKLLIDEGILLLQEFIQPWRFADAMFGILDSYWRFRDYDLRKLNPMVSKEIWDRVLTENGFGLSCLTTNDPKSSSVLAAKANVQRHHLPSLGSASNIWLVFSDSGVLYERMTKLLLNIGHNVIILKHGLQSNSNSGNRTEQFVDMLDEFQFEEAINRILELNDVCGMLYLIPLDSENDNTNELYIKTLNFCKYFTKSQIPNVKLVVVTRGAVYATNQENVLPSVAVIWGMLKSLMNEAPKLSISLVDMDPDEVDIENNSKEIFFECFHPGRNFYCYRKSKKFVPRFVKFSEDNEILSLPKGRYKLKLPKTKRIADVSFTTHKICPLEPEDVEVIIKAISLNFKDIFVIMKPDGFRSLNDEVGTDFSGIVSKIGSRVSRFKLGDEVFGFGIGTAGSHVIQKETSAIYHKPSHFNIFEAAAIPSCYLTAHYCLDSIAGLKKDETVLIHVASGGVGLFAIQIAKYIGARIIATAGNRRKRCYLESLGLQYVFNSRDLSFGEGIKKTTNGNGVDVVLNSLTSEGFKETTLENCAKNARFVEIGKVNIWKPEDVRKLRPDVKYTIVDLEIVEPSALAENIQVVYNKDIIKPVAYSRFDITNIRNALNYFMKAHHIGKIVLTMPEISNIGCEVKTKDFLFSKNATYLITGGLGGIGLEVAKWMADYGAGCLILIGRSAPNSEALIVLDTIRSRGCRVLPFQVDVGNLQQCENLFQKIHSDKLSLPPLKGVIHSAGVLSDAVFANQTWEKYQSVFNAKIQGCLNLHNLTKQLQLEHFVLFSSMAAIFAPLGQSNHCAANSFLDAFARYRYSIGLPAQSINWGVWSDVGMATNFDVSGIYSFNPGQGISALQFAMSRPNLVQLGALEINLKELGNLTPIFEEYFQEDLDDADKSKTWNTSILDSEQLLKDLKSLDVTDGKIYFKNLLCSLIKDILKISKREQINEHQMFYEMGLDSLMSVELKNKLQSILGNTVTLRADTLTDYPNVSKLIEYLTCIILEKTTIDSETEFFDKDILKNLIEKDSFLPEDIRGSGNFVKASQIRKILLTGGTGHLGAHILENVLKMPFIIVICLVRSSTQELAYKRLIKNLQKYNLTIDLDRISVVVGDVAQDLLGMALEEYNSLSREVDAIYHISAKVNFVDEYWNSSPNKTDLRSVNVLGTINVLRFACNIKTKRLFYSSSIVAINQLNADGFAYEEFPDDENNAEGLALGYALTKFVGEKLIGQAISRGIPCIVIRYPNIAGNSVTGYFSIGTDFVINSFLLAIKLGIICVNEGGWSFMAPDIAAELTMDFLFNDNVDSEMYNLIHTNTIKVNEFINIVSDQGYKLTIVSQDEIIETMQKHIGDDGALSFFSKDFLSNLFTDNIYMAKHFLTGSLMDTKFSQKTLKVIPNIADRIGSSYDGAKKFLTYAKSVGIL